MAVIWYAPIGAHLDEPMIQAALDGMDPRREGFIEVGETTGKIHYRFATELLWSALLRDVPDQQHVGKMEDLLGKSASLIRGISAIDNVMICYLKERKLP